MKEKFKKQYLLFVLFVFMNSMNTFSQQIKSVMPYKMLGGKMIVKMNIEGKAEDFIFDTGSEVTLLTTAFCQSNSLVISDSLKITDANNNSSYFKQTNIDVLATTDNKIKFNNVNPIVVDGKEMFDCYNVVGLIGCDLFGNNLICTIDSKEKTITLTSADKKSPESLRYVHNFKSNKNLPIIELLINGKSLNVLFDTGAGGFLLLKNSDFSNLESLSALEVLSTGSGERTMSVSGIEENHDQKRVKMEDMRLGLAKFKDVVATTGEAPFSLFGVKSIDYGKVVIDFPRRLFYYIPFTNVPVTPDYTLRDFDIQVEDGKLVVANVWSELASVISPGDPITHIDGKETGIYDFCESITIGIEELKNKKSRLTILTKENKSVELDFVSTPKKNKK